MEIVLNKCLNELQLFQFAYQKAHGFTYQFQDYALLTDEVGDWVQFIFVPALQQYCSMPMS